KPAESLRRRVDNGPHLFERAHDNTRTIRERLRQRLLDSLREGGMIRAAGGPEENVAALNVGHHVAEALGFEADLELRHRDEIVATDVDGAQQCDVQVHGLLLTPLARQLRGAHVYRLRVSSPGIQVSLTYAPNCRR